MEYIPDSLYAFLQEPYPYDNKYLSLATKYIKRNKSK